MATRFGGYKNSIQLKMLRAFSIVVRLVLIDYLSSPLGRQPTTAELHSVSS